MPPTVADAMKLAESGRFEDAAAAFAPLAAPAGDGVIARFRRAECLSRLARHDEAIDEARRAHADAPDAPATAIWLACTLAEAGRFDEAAAVGHPKEQWEYVGPVAAGYTALAKLAANAPDGRDDVVAAILDSRHAPLHSLALRLAEARRLAAEPRWPDVPSVWYRHECSLEMEEDGLTDHPQVPRFLDRSGFLGAFLRRSQQSNALRWLRIHASCGDWSQLIESLRTATPDDDQLPGIEREMLLSLGRLDAAQALADRLAAAAGDEAPGELAIDRCRLAQLRGTPARPRDFAGYADATRRLKDAIAWLDCCSALMTGDTPAARASADQVSDPAHREFVEAALLRWARS